MLTRPLVTASLLLLVTGCAPAIVAGGAGVVSSATSERGLGGTVDDIGIKAGIQKRWFEKDADLVKRLDLNVQEGRVLITGIARTPEQKLMASQVAWEAQGVKEVINEATLDGSMTFSSYSKDTWITTKLRTFLTFDGDIAGRNYTIETVNSVVYLMGYARSQAELNRVTTHASTISGVQKVVSYVRVGNEPVGSAAASGSASSYDGGNSTGAPSTVSGGTVVPRGGPVLMEPISTTTPAQ